MSVDAFSANKTDFEVGKFSELTPQQVAELKNGPGFDAFRAVTVNSKIEQLVNAERHKQARKAERRGKFTSNHSYTYKKRQLT